MKVVSYSFQEKGSRRFLYLDKDFDGSKFPAKVKKIVSKEKPHICREPVRLIPKEVTFFKKNGYLFAPGAIFTELEFA